MSHEILAVKLCELDDQLARLSSRIHLCETESGDQLHREICALSRECAEAELTLKNRLRLSRAEIVSAYSTAYEEIEQYIQKAKVEFQAQAACQKDADAVSEEKILLAEYALDFAMQAANRALLLSMEAIASQSADQESERPAIKSQAEKEKKVKEKM